jgi:hypothetical protein
VHLSHPDPEHLPAFTRREAAGLGLSDAGRVVRWTWEDIWRRPGQTCARLTWALGMAA